MVEDSNGGVALIGGRSSSVGILDTLYQLPHGGQDAIWSKMEQKIKINRRWKEGNILHFWSLTTLLIVPKCYYHT
jgi:hypothetical protein